LSAAKKNESLFYWALVLATGILVLAFVLGAERRPVVTSGTVSGQVRIKKDGKLKADASGVVVFLEGVSETASGKQVARPRIRQKDLAFDPLLTAVPKGTTIDFPNDDKVFHNVFSLSRPARFDLGLYKQGDSKSVTFSRPGVVDVYCNIHPEMVAKIKVLDTSYYAKTDKSGSFRIEHVPPGTYPVIVWHPFGEEVRTQVTVDAGKTARLAPEVVEDVTRAHHLRKDGTPYGRYK
jgi:plastocyanin